jgi:hypothetical protein
MKRLTAGLSILVLGVALSSAQAQETPAAAAPISPAAVEQIVLAQKLAAIGAARKDPLLMLAAAQLRGSLDQAPVPAGDKFDSLDEMLAAAREFAQGREDIIGIADDIAAGSSRGWQPGGSYCFGSSCSGNGF